MDACGIAADRGARSGKECDDASQRVACARPMSGTASLPRSIETVAPFRHSSESRTAVPATVRGKVPSWLGGEVVRTCPVVFEMQGWRAEHWFDGLGMVYAFRIGDGAGDFRSRLLDSEAAR